MSDFGLLSICATAFTAVFLLLGFLAVVMHFIIEIFPENETAQTAPAGNIDHAVVAAITAAAGSAYPGAKVLKIEEKK